MLTSPYFQLKQGEHAHDQFWRVLVNQSHDFTAAIADDAIDTLIEYLPRYSLIASDDRGLRQRSVYSLLRLLDRAGWGRTSGRRRNNTAENVVEIAWRIFGENAYRDNGLIGRLASVDRGVFGWNDLMLFRLQCSADRQGQLYQLHSALIVHQDPNAETTGLVSKLALKGMRGLSQVVFALFKRRYIDTRTNFFSEVSAAPDEALLGEATTQPAPQASLDGQSDPKIDSLAQRVSSARTAVKSFVIYQLSNRFPPNGAGVGCGYYDESGTTDGGGVAKLMNEYVFGFCFNPDIHLDNVLHFLDHCLSHLSNSIFSDRDEGGYFASKAELSGGLDPKEMGRYWIRYRELISKQVLHVEDRCVVTPNYQASYRSDLPGVFAALDQLADDATADEGASAKLAPSQS